MKNLLWSERFNVLRKTISIPWKYHDISKAAKGLKNNQTMDPNGMINELLKANIMGEDLQLANLELMNVIKNKFEFPEFMEVANMSTIYKNK